MALFSPAAHAAGRPYGRVPMQVCKKKKEKKEKERYATVWV
jgi:hypothetical protein